MNAPPRYLRRFDEIRIGDLGLVGGKNAALGELYGTLARQGVRSPDGFAITADAYRDLLRSANALPALQEALDGLRPDDLDDLARRARRAREIVQLAPFPADLERQILEGYAALRAEYGEDLRLAVRSSATAEDLPNASFAGQQDSFLNVRGEAALIKACRRCFASLFTDRAVHYRLDQRFDHFSVALSIGVEKMVRSDLAASGIMFTLDTESGFRDVVLISASYGLGENIVQGAVDPDDFLVFKPTFARGHRAVLRRELGSKKLKMVFAADAAQNTTHNLETTAEERGRFCIADEDVMRLADYALKVEAHFSERAGRPVAMDMEWAKDGVDGEIYLVQARPETVASRRNPQLIDEYRLRGSGRVRLRGRAVGTRIGSGVARVVRDVREAGGFRPGEVLVTENTTPDWEPIMKRAAAIVTDRGGRTCHAAIVARELGIPAVVGTGNATGVLHSGETVTTVCSSGEVGQVYDGAIPFEIEHLDVGTLERPKTKVMLILGNPDVAFQTSFLPNDGVGLARMEFVITEYVKAHPMALLHPERIVDRSERAEIEAMTRGYAHPADYFVQRLAEGVAMLAAAFHPKPVILRMSDFKSNEYARLVGGRAFEPVEENPMLGFRGAARYSHPAYAEGFALEVAAVKRVREFIGLDNLKIMVPFCRRVVEAERTIDTLRRLGLSRGRDGLEIYMMCEIPNNVIQIDEFARYFDGFSIGSNDLTQLTLGVDRDSALVEFDFDERDPGVERMLALAVEGARRNGRHSGICGQAPSDFPEVAEFLVGLGIDSISLNPDTIVSTTRRILDCERRREDGGRLTKSTSDAS
ncbi:MAG: phosphoenolpyruvate synthase [Gammaproteobacteria bacterium]|nr:phosphoenolpyruvate synthase [Gammaproteobacteria bacterium]